MKSSIIIIALTSIVVNLYIASKTELISDTVNFYRVGKAVINLENPYIGLKDAYPYPPLSMFISGLNYKVSQITHLAFPFVNRIIPVFSFVILGLVTFNTILKEHNFKKVVLYFFNPLIILVTTYVGQNDILVILLLILGLLFLNKRPFTSGLLIAFASLIKIYPLFILPLILFAFKKQKKNLLKFLSVFIVTNLLFWLPFLFISFKDTIISVFYYKGFADFGWGGIIRTILLFFGKDFISSHLFTLKLSKIGLILFLGFYLVNFRKLIKENNLFKKNSTIFASFLVLYPNISIQYLIWILPFYFFYKPLGVLVKYTIFATLTGVYFFLFSNPNLLGVEKINTNFLILLILQATIYLYTLKLLYE